MESPPPPVNKIFFEENCLCPFDSLMDLIPEDDNHDHDDDDHDDDDDDDDEETATDIGTDTGTELGGEYCRNIDGLIQTQSRSSPFANVKDEDLNEIRVSAEAFDESMVETQKQIAAKTHIIDKVLAQIREQDELEIYENDSKETPNETHRKISVEFDILPPEFDESETHNEMIVDKPSTGDHLEMCYEPCDENLIHEKADTQLRQLMTQKMDALQTGSLDEMRRVERGLSVHITTLKDRLDKKQSQLNMAEWVANELEKFKTEAQEQKTLRSSQMGSVKKDFKILTDKHDRVVKLLKALKEKNSLLQGQISKMKREDPSRLAKVLQEKSVMVQHLNRNVAKMKLKLNERQAVYEQKVFERENNIEKERAAMLESVLRKTKRQLHDNLECVKAATKAKQDSMYNSLNEKKQKEAALTERKRQMLVMMKDMKEKTPELVDQIKVIREIQAKDAEEQVKLLKELQGIKLEFKNKIWKIDTVENIKKLKNELMSLKEEVSDAMRAFSVYKRHTNHLIEREKRLNERFCDLHRKSYITWT